MEGEPTVSRGTLTRRNVLQAALAAAAPYVITSAALGGRGPLSPSERIGMGFIGLGGRGGGILSHFLRKGVS
jgi:hypothetical protein